MAKGKEKAKVGGIRKDPLSTLRKADVLTLQMTRDASSVAANATDAIGALTT